MLVQLLHVNWKYDQNRWCITAGHGSIHSRSTKANRHAKAGYHTIEDRLNIQKTGNEERKGGCVCI